MIGNERHHEHLHTFELLGSYTDALIAKIGSAERKTSHRAAVQLLMATPHRHQRSQRNPVSTDSGLSPTRLRDAPKLEKCPGVFATARPANRLNSLFPNAPTGDYPRGRRVDASLGAKLETCSPKSPGTEAPGS